MDVKVQCLVREIFWRDGIEYVKKRLAEIRPYGNNPRINDGAVDDVV